MARKHRTTATLPISEYVPETSSLSLEQAYKEYTRIRRNVAMPRLSRLSKSGFGWTETAKQSSWIKDRPASTIAPGDIRAALLDIYKFISTERSTVGRQREMIETEQDTLQSHGYEIDDESLPRFHRFMHLLSKRTKGKYESARAADMFSEMDKQGLVSSQKNAEEVARHYEFYKKHMDQVEKEAKNFRGSAGGLRLSEVRRALEAMGEE